MPKSDVWLWVDNVNDAGLNDVIHLMDSLQKQSDEA
jgi:hypothetical protein